MVMARVKPGKRAELSSALEGLFAEAGEGPASYSVSDDLVVVSESPSDLAWVLAQGPTVFVIPSARKVEHILADQFMLASAPAKSGTERASWVDYGRDNYAGVTFNGLPDDQRGSLRGRDKKAIAGLETSIKTRILF